MINLGNLDEALTVSERHNVVLKEEWTKKLIPAAVTGNKAKE
jgi:hypothetical protein